MKRLISIIIILCLIQILSADEIWKEDFSSYAAKTGLDGENNLGDYPGSVTKWTLDISNCDFSQSSDYFRVVSERMRVVDSDGEAVWISQSINIASYSDVKFSILLDGDDSDNDATDYIAVSYSVDNGNETVVVNKNGQFVPNTVTSPIINGATLRIYVRIDNNAGSEQYNFDDIVVTGTPIVVPVDEDSYITNSTTPIQSKIFIPSASSTNDLIEVFSFKIVDSGSSDMFPTKISEIKIVKPNSISSLKWSQTIDSALLYSNSRIIATDSISITDNEILFIIKSDSLVVTNNSFKQIVLSVSVIDDKLVDNLLFQFLIPNKNHQIKTEIGFSQLLTTFQAEIISEIHKVQITATKLIVRTLPTTVLYQQRFSLLLDAVDDFGNTDLDFNSDLSVSLNGLASLSLCENKTINNGTFSCDSVYYTGTDDFSFSIKSELLTSEVYPLSVDNRHVYLSETFTPTVTWSDTLNWSVVNQNETNFVLQHKDRDTTGVYTTFQKVENIPLNEGETTWEFILGNSNWNPSSSNNFGVWLMAHNNEDVLNGVLVGVNFNKESTDELTLYSVKDGVKTTIINTDFYWTKNMAVALKINRSAMGLWNVALKENSAYRVLNTGLDSSLYETNLCGIQFNVSSKSRLGGVWLDDISIKGPQPFDSNSFLNDFVTLTDTIYSTNNSLSRSIQLLSFSVTDSGGTDEKATNIKSILFHNLLDSISSLDWSKSIASIYFTNQLDTILTDSIMIYDNRIYCQFDDGKLAIPNGENSTILTHIYLTTDVNDQRKIQLSIPKKLQTYSSGSSIINDTSTFVFKENFVQVKASKFVVLSDSIAIVNQPFTLKIALLDEWNNIDLDTNFIVSLDTSVNQSFENTNTMIREKGTVCWKQLLCKISGNHSISVVSQDEYFQSSVDFKILSYLSRDSFQDSNFVMSPEWIGDVNDFIIKDEILCLNGIKDSDSCFLSVPIEFKDSCEWSFNVKLNFNPSNKNRVKIFLLSDSYNLENTENGFYVAIGESHADSLKFYRRTEGDDILLFTGKTSFSENVDTHMKIRYNFNGEWSFYIVSSNKEHYISEGNPVLYPIDNENLCMGVVCEYSTSSRRDQFSFDDFYYGLPVYDTITPKISHVEIISRNLISLNFTEPLFIGDSVYSVYNIENYLLDGRISPDSILYELSENIVQLWFNNDLSMNETHKLTVSNIADNSVLVNIVQKFDTLFVITNPIIVQTHIIDSNIMLIQYNKNVLFDLKQTISVNNKNNIAELSYFNSDSSKVKIIYPQSFIANNNNIIQTPKVTSDIGASTLDELINVFYYKIERHSVVINEFLSKTTPKIALPEIEYVEFKNNSGVDLYLNEWSVNDVVISNFLLKSDSLVIICGECDSLLHLQRFGLTICADGLNLRNSKTEIVLKDRHNMVIDYFLHDFVLDGDQFKKLGGWSLEKIDSYNYCTRKSNWKYSESSYGGTPGKENSIMSYNPDIERPFVSHISVLPDSSTINVRYSEGINSKKLVDYRFYDNGTLGSIDSIYSDSPDLRSVFLKFENTIVPNTKYILDIGDVSDCNQNRLNLDKSEFMFAIPMYPKFNEIVLNEILFQPYAGESKYIEIFNCTDNIFISDSLVFAKYDSTESKYIISELTKNRYIEPGEYQVYSNNPKSVKDVYFVDDLSPIYLANINRVITSSGGEIQIARYSQKNLEPLLINKVKYNSKMHHSFISNHKGVALERIHNDPKTTLFSSWHSASEESGFGTPTKQNSQFRDEEIVSHKLLSLSSKSISPDNDGFEDYVVINYMLKTSGNMGTMSIFSDRGIHVADLLKNQLLQSKGHAIWDGVNANGDTVSMGIYIVYFEVISDRGSVSIEKSVIVVLKK